MPRFGQRDGRWVVESAPSVIAELTRHVEVLSLDVRGEQVVAFPGIEQVSAEEGQRVLAANYARYVEEYGEPSSPGTVQLHIVEL